MSVKLYRLMVLSGALAWTMVGMYGSRILQRIDAGEPQSGNDQLMVALWLVMAVSDLWALIRSPTGGVGGGESSTTAT